MSNLEFSFLNSIKLKKVFKLTYPKLLVSVSNLFNLTKKSSIGAKYYK